MPDDRRRDDDDRDRRRDEGRRGAAAADEGGEAALCARFIDVFRLAALQAGAVARHLQGRVKGERKEGATPEAAAISAVDLATQEVILHALAARLPEVAIDAEEDTELVACFPAAVDGRPEVVIDPVDGTLSYLMGSEEFAVMGGLIIDGRYEVSVIHYPALGGWTYWARRGVGCWRARGMAAGARVRVGRPPSLALHGPRVEAAWRGAIAPLAEVVRLSRCSAVEAAAPVIDLARLSVNTGEVSRRRAIGFLLTEEAGGAVYLGARRWRGEDPRALALGTPPTVVAEDAALAEAALARLQAVGAV